MWVHGQAGEARGALLGLGGEQGRPATPCQELTGRFQRSLPRLPPTPELWESSRLPWRLGLEFVGPGIAHSGGCQEVGGGGGQAGWTPAHPGSPSHPAFLEQLGAAGALSWASGWAGGAEVKASSCLPAVTPSSVGLRSATSFLSLPRGPHGQAVWPQVLLESLGPGSSLGQPSSSDCVTTSLGLESCRPL